MQAELRDQVMTAPTTLKPAAEGYLGYAPIDCDIHPAVPDTRVLLPYFDDYWREQITQRGIERHSLNLTSYPPGAPASARPDYREKGKKTGSDLAIVQRQALDPFGT